MKNVFEALPHVDKIWVTKDGHFHLHPNNGGELIERGSEPIELTEPKKWRKPKVDEK